MRGIPGDLFQSAYPTRTWSSIPNMWCYPWAILWFTSTFWVRWLPARKQLPGDDVDKGKQSRETIYLLLLYKIKYPENYFLLRGNHECASINGIFGFYDECKRRYIKLWKTFTGCFNCLPIAAIVDKKIFCCHGGLSPVLQSMEPIRQIMQPTDIYQLNIFFVIFCGLTPIKVS